VSGEPKFSLSLVDDRERSAFAAWTLVARSLLNLDETITKE
jgi:hypothetical protein